MLLNFAKTERAYFTGHKLCDLTIKICLKELNFAKIVKILTCLNKLLDSELAQLILIFYSNKFPMTVNKTIEQNKTDYCDNCAKDILQELQQEQLILIHTKRALMAGQDNGRRELTDVTLTKELSSRVLNFVCLIFLRTFFHGSLISRFFEKLSQKSSPAKISNNKINVHLD